MVAMKEPLKYSKNAYRPCHFEISGRVRENLKDKLEQVSTEFLDEKVDEVAVGTIPLCGDAVVRTFVMKLNKTSQMAETKHHLYSTRKRLCTTYMLCI